MVLPPSVPSLILCLSVSLEQVKRAGGIRVCPSQAGDMDNTFRMPTTSSDTICAFSVVPNLISVASYAGLRSLWSHVQ